MAKYIIKKMPNFIVLLFSYLSKCTVYMLVINTAFQGKLIDFALNTLSLNQDNLPNMVVVLLLELLISMVLFIPIQLFENKVVAKKLKA